MTFGNMIYQYFFHNNIDSAYNELKDRSFKRIMITLTIVVGILFVLFTSIAYFGYMINLDLTPITIVNQNDKYNVIGRLIMFIFLCISTMMG